MHCTGNKLKSRTMIALMLVCNLLWAVSSMAGSSTQDVESQFEMASKLSPQEKMKGSSELISGMKDTLTRSFELLEQARVSKDMIRLNCVNEKLTGMKGLLKVAEQAGISLQEAIARPEKDVSDHEFTKIAIAHTRMSALGVEVETCAGESLRYTGDTQVEYSVDPNLTGDDPTVAKSSEPMFDVRPPAASPYQ